MVACYQISGHHCINVLLHKFNFLAHWNWILVFSCTENGNSMQEYEARVYSLTTCQMPPWSNFAKVMFKVNCTYIMTEDELSHLLFIKLKKVESIIPLRRCGGDERKEKHTWDSSLKSWKSVTLPIHHSKNLRLLSS